IGGTGRPAHGKGAGGVFGDQAQIRQVERNVEIGDVAGKGTIGPKLNLRIGDSEIVSANACFGPRQTARQVYRTGQQSVGRGIIHGQVAANAIEDEVEAARERHDPAGGDKVKTTRERTPGKAREGRDIFGRNLDAPVEIRAVDQAGKAGRQRLAHKTQLGQFDRFTRVPETGQPEPHTIAQ